MKNGDVGVLREEESGSLVSPYDSFFRCPSPLPEDRRAGLMNFCRVQNAPVGLPPADASVVCPSTVSSLVPPTYVCITHTV